MGVGSQGRIELNVIIGATDTASDKARKVSSELEAMGSTGKRAGLETASGAKAAAGGIEGLTKRLQEMSTVNKLGSAIKGFLALEAVNTAISLFGKLSDKIKQLQADAHAISVAGAVTGSMKLAQQEVERLTDALDIEDEAAAKVVTSLARAGMSHRELMLATQAAVQTNEAWGTSVDETTNKLIEARKKGPEAFAKALRELGNENAKAVDRFQELSEIINDTYLVDGARFTKATHEMADLIRFNATQAVNAYTAGIHALSREIATVAGDTDTLTAAIGKLDFRQRLILKHKAEGKAAPTDLELGIAQINDAVERDAWMKRIATDKPTKGRGGRGRAGRAGDGWDSAKELRNIEMQWRAFRDEDAAKNFREGEEKANEAARQLYDAVANAELYKPLIEDMRATADAADYLGAAIGRMQALAPGFGEAAEAIAKGFRGFTEALDQGDWEGGVNAVAQTMSGVTAALKIGRKEQAVIEILAETAMSIASFASQNYVGGAQHAAAAVAWGATLAATGGGGKPAAGGGSTGGYQAPRPNFGSPFGGGGSTTNIFQIQGTLVGTTQQLGALTSRAEREARRGGMAGGGRA